MEPYTSTIRLLASAHKTCIFTVIILYCLLVRYLRYKRRDRTPHTLHYPDRPSWARITLQDAHSIQLTLAEQEFPTTFSLSIFFSLFKTYGIPGISSLLVATGQLSGSATASKRAADTGVVITEVVLNEPDSERAIGGIALMNYLHGRYRKAGKISDEDMLYTLSLFVLEPIRWTANYEWRDVTDFEKCAMGVYLKDLGEKMEISYGGLPSASEGWRDGLHWLGELESWSLEYEMRCMVPAETNAVLARTTLGVALFNVPVCLRPSGVRMVSALLGTRLRRAMKLEKPPAIYTYLLTTIVEVRKFALRNFVLPRPACWRRKWFTELDAQTGRAHFCQYIAHPWYIEPTFAARWGLKALFLRFIGGAVPGENRYFPDGYRIHELGPEELVGKGGTEMERVREELRGRRRRVCGSAMRETEVLESRLDSTIDT